MRVTILSLWRNDSRRNIADRALRLLAKDEVTDWLWVVGDSSDDTEQILRGLANASSYSRSVEVLRCDSGICDNSLSARLERLSSTFSQAIKHLLGSGRAAGAYANRWVCLHESDLLTSQTLVPDLLRAGLWPIAGWPTMDGLFYDTWGYRCVRSDGGEGRCFTPDEARPSAVFEVSSFGSCWIAPLASLEGIHLQTLATVELCRQWRAMGFRLWVDPCVTVEQPSSLWEFWDARELSA